MPNGTEEDQVPSPFAIAIAFHTHSSLSFLVCTPPLHAMAPVLSSMLVFREQKKEMEISQAKSGAERQGREEEEKRRRKVNGNKGGDA